MSVKKFSDILLYRVRFVQLLDKLILARVSVR